MPTARIIVTTDRTCLLWLGSVVLIVERGPRGSRLTACLGGAVLCMRPAARC